MAFLFRSVLFFFLATAVSVRAQYPPMTLTLVNNCPQTIWPAIQSNAGHAVLEGGGFELPPLSHRSFWAPADYWTGRVWARTGCYYGRGGRFTCDTGDCGGRLQCSGLGGSPPATLAQISLHSAGYKDKTSYSVSLVDGFNLPMTITPHEGQGTCPVVGCRANLLSTCPPQLQLKSHDQRIVGCKSGCLALGTDKLCCRNKYNSPSTCKASDFSKFFKDSCPATYTFAQDSPSLLSDCAAPKELKIIFCH